MNSSQLIEKLNKFYEKLGTGKKYSFLIKGKWGIGKTYTYDRFIEKKNLENKSYKYSLFGMKDLRELEKELLKDRFFPTIKKLQDGASKKVISNILSGVLKSIPKGKAIVESIEPSKLIELLSIKDLDYDEKSLVCLDDFERCDIPMKDLMGFIERLKQKTNIIILCNEEELKENQVERYKVYKSYKEKVIDFTYSLEEVEDKIILGKLSELKLSADMENIILDEFKKYCKDNLRILEKFIHLYRELIFDLENYRLKLTSKQKIIQASFYLVCEENLRLIEDYIEKNKDTEEEKYEKYYRENIYFHIYKFGYKELIGEIEKYFLGSKDNMNEIIKNLKIEIEETKEFLENEVKLYFLLDKESTLELYEKIECVFTKSTIDNYATSDDLLKLYTHYKYLSKIINREEKIEIKDKIEELLYHFYKKNPNIRTPTFFKEILHKICSDILKELKNKFEQDNNYEDIIEAKIKEKSYGELLEIAQKLKYLPKAFEGYLKESFTRGITLDEWRLWNELIEGLKDSERKKIEDIIETLEIKDNIIKERIKHLCENWGLKYGLKS